MPCASAAHSVGDAHSPKYGLKTIPAIIIEGKIKIMYLIFLWLRLGLYKTYKKNIAATTNTLPFLLSGKHMANSLHSYNRIPNIGDGHSNTPVVYDGIGPVMRDSHSQHQAGFVVFIDALGVRNLGKNGSQCSI